MGRIGWRALGVGVAVAVLATCAARAPVPPEDPHPERQSWVSRVDWQAARDEAVSVLSSYLAIDTSNPPGRETLGADYLAGLLTAEGIEVTTYAFAPGRSNLIARLKADVPQEPPLCLLSHIDVVTVEREHWKQDPFAGLVDDQGYLWGRGALDMKGVGVVELLSMVWLHRLGVPLRRDVVLLAVGDEEVDNLGVRDLAANHWDELGCAHIFNEGGMGVDGALFDGLTTFAISYTEKGALWLRMWAEGEPGHGSTPMPDSAPVRLQQALARLDTRKPEPVWSDELLQFTHAIGERTGGLTGAVLRSRSLTKALAAPRFMANPLGEAMLTNTVNVTGFGGAQAPNVVPSEVFAQLDVRMLPGVTGEQMLGELEALVDGVPGIRFERIADSPAAVSPVQDPVYDAVVRQLQIHFPDAAVGPIVMPGSTDCGELRPLGAHCYGIAPFVFTTDEMRGMHGHDERIHVDNLGRGLQVMFSIVLDVAAAAPAPAIGG
ncbi:MAG: M20/M25/M40 family metallo-hydrolase [Alphaproteobacteria bacterium]|nr:M20/M25/M40 family metallo-hydrolase [Alphaproteobacteria bacterium]